MYNEFLPFKSQAHIQLTRTHNEVLQAKPACMHSLKRISSE